MAKKAKVTVKSYFKDLMGWFGLMKARQAWIDAGDPNIDTSDRSAELAKDLHADRVLAKIVNIREETPSTRTYTLAAEDGYNMPYFNAGQHVSVKFKINGNWLTRPFSVSSEPELTDDGLLELTIRKMPGGYVSGWIFDNWQVGTEVIFSGAFGDGSYNSLRDTKHVVGIAGGSGITAFRSIARDMKTSHRPEKLTILYGSRNESDIIFFDELNKIAAESDGAVEVVNVLSEPGEGWTGEKGFISADVIRKGLTSRITSADLRRCTTSSTASSRRWALRRDASARKSTARRPTSRSLLCTRRDTRTTRSESPCASVSTSA